MGYRSEVSIQVEKKAFDMIMESIKKYNETQEWKFEPDVVFRNSDEYILVWNNVKWYSDYEDVKAVDNVLKELNKLKDVDGYRYRFYRLGEDAGDIETLSNDYCYGDICPEVHIYIPNEYRQL